MALSFQALNRLRLKAWQMLSSVLPMELKPAKYSKFGKPTEKGRRSTVNRSADRRPFLYKGIVLAIEVFGNRAQDFRNLATSFALRVTPLRKHWLYLGFKQGHDIGKHAREFIRFARRLRAASRSLEDFYAQGLWATTSSSKVEFNALALHQLLNTFRKYIPADIDIFISGIRDKAKTLFSVKPLNFADWHWAHHFHFNREKDILPRNWAITQAATHVVNMQTQMILCQKFIKLNQAEFSYNPSRQERNHPKCVPSHSKFLAICWPPLSCNNHSIFNVPCEENIPKCHETIE